jgi:hypothetical protein
MIPPPPVAIPNPDLPVEREAVAQAIEALTASLSTARLQAEAGVLIDLSGLDRRVQTLCAAVARLDDEAGRSLLARLTALAHALDALEQLLKRRDRVAPTRAADAYRSTADRSL